jgi:hypothetical protein
MTHLHRPTAFAVLALVAAGCSAGAGGRSPRFEEAPRDAFNPRPAEPAKEVRAREGFHADGDAPGQPSGIPGLGAPEAQKAPSAARRGGGDEAFESRPRDDVRPGLATQWGETVTSRVTSAPFSRAESSSPFAFAKLFYNDASGVNAMANGAHRMGRVTFPAGAGFVEIGLRDARGRFISGFSAGGNNYVPGSSGDRYAIVVKNKSPGRVEAVVSVDGLDVIDGKPAALDKRGYLLEAFSEVEIDGFRTSTSQVAAFRFGAVEDSYAELKHGDARNVGVIGLAVFHERGDSPSNWPMPRDTDADHRLDANPFPMQFAQPPR